MTITEAWLQHKKNCRICDVPIDETEKHGFEAGYNVAMNIVMHTMNDN